MIHHTVPSTVVIIPLPCTILELFPFKCLSFSLPISVSFTGVMRQRLSFYHCSGDDMALLWYLLSPSDNFWALRNICSKISIKILLSNKMYFDICKMWAILLWPQNLNLCFYCFQLRRRGSGADMWLLRCGLSHSQWHPEFHTHRCSQVAIAKITFGYRIRSVMSDKRVLVDYLIQSTDFFFN